MIPFYIKLALGFLVTGFVVHLIGFTTPYWVSSNVNSGLWQRCWDTYRYGHTCYSIRADSALNAVRAFQVLAFLMFIAVIVLLFIYLSTLRTNLQLASIICTFILVAFIIVGVIIYAADTNNLSWSLGLCVAGAILAFIAGILLLIYRMRGVTLVTGGSGTVTTRTTRTVTRVVVR